MIEPSAPHRAIAISVLTPTWNRGHLLPRVFAGLMAQTDMGFEWIIGDDGSDDDTCRIVADMARDAPFPVVRLRADGRVGKSRMDNAAIRQARGELVLWCDSDDYLTPDAIATLKAAWQSIPPGDRERYVGVTALAATKEGVIVDPMPGVEHCDIAWNEMTESRGINADMVYMARTDILRRHPFPEVDMVIPESVVWSRIGDMPARYIAKIVKMVEYRAANAISFSGHMAYNRGRAHALALTGAQLRAYPRPAATRWWRLLTFIRYATHGEIGPAKSRSLWGDNPLGRWFWLAYPVARALALYDVLRGKVVRSHRQFDSGLSIPITIRPEVGKRPTDTGAGA